MQKHILRQLDEIRAAGTWKRERVITTPQDAHICVAGSTSPVLNLCANNYLGLADHPALIRAAHEALDRWGYGLSSVRFICGTQTPHQDLERNSASSSAPTTRFFTVRVSTPTAACSRPCSGRKTPSSPTS